MTFSDHFSSVAKQYSAFRPDYPEDLLVWLAEISPNHTVVWDCACGSGQASRGLAKVFDHVIATDASEEQIAAAKPHPKIQYRVALAEDSKLAEHSVDLVTVAQAAHWFRLDKFYEEIHRVLKPNGVLALWTYEFFSIDDKNVEDCIRNFYENVIGPYWPPERKYVASHYRTLPFPFDKEINPPQFQQNISWNLAQILGYFSSWSAVKRFKQANNMDPVEKFAIELAPLWGDPNLSRSITMPLYMRVARV